MEKKSERLEVRLGYQEKQAFTEACDTQGDTPSGAIRRFINGYVRRADADLLSSAWRSAATRRGWKPAALVTIFAVIAAVFLGISKRSLVHSDDEIFSSRDLNRDGQLENAEHGIPPGSNNTPNGVMRVLDLDSSGTISREEFVGKGVMAFALVEAASADMENKNNQEVTTLVEFEFSKERTRSVAFSGQKVNSDGIDRLVVWPNVGAPLVMEGEVAIATGLDGIIEFQADTITKLK